MRRTFAALFGLVLVAPVGCKKVQEGPMAVCSSIVEGGEAEETQSQNVQPEVWFALILRGYSSKTGEASDPVLDCTGKPLEMEDEQVASCITPENPPAKLPGRPLDGDQDLEIIGIDEGKALVWVRTDYFDNGDALGPIALAEYRKDGVAIRAIGPLRANPNRVRMRLEKLGETTVIVVESMVCDPEDANKCARVMRIIPQDGHRFVERPLINDADDACLGPATFPLTRELEVERENGTVRRFELVRTFDFEEGAVTVSEQVLIKDIDPNQPDAPPAVFRKAQIQRQLELGPGGLRTNEPLWERLIAEHGSVEVKAEPVPTNGEGEGGEAAEGEDAAAG